MRRWARRCLREARRRRQVQRYLQLAVSLLAFAAGHRTVWKRLPDVLRA